MGSNGDKCVTMGADGETPKAVWGQGEILLSHQLSRSVVESPLPYTNVGASPLFGNYKV